MCINIMINTKRQSRKLKYETANIIDHHVLLYKAA